MNGRDTVHYGPFPTDNVAASQSVESGFHPVPMIETEVVHYDGELLPSNLHRYSGNRLCPFRNGGGLQIQK